MGTYTRSGLSCVGAGAITLVLACAAFLLMVLLGSSGKCSDPSTCRTLPTATRKPARLTSTPQPTGTATLEPTEQKPLRTGDLAWIYAWDAPSAWVARNEADLRAAWAVYDPNPVAMWQRVTRLPGFEIDNGATVRVLTPGRTAAEIVVVDGESTGLSGWAPVEWLVKQ